MSNVIGVKTQENLQQKFIAGVYGWMVLALAISGFCAYVTANNEMVFRFIFSSKYIFYSLLIAELAVVFVLSSRIGKMSTKVAAFWFLLYSVLNGVTLASIFYLYTATSIARIFFITAGMFGGMSLYGLKTKSDLMSFGRYFMMAVIGLIIASVINIFFRSSGLDWLISIITVVVFTGLTAYDTQKMLRLSTVADGSDIFGRAAIIGALELYLDFINIFLALLRLFGRSKD